MQLQFTDEEAVYRFYKTYAMMHGFAVRLDEVRRDSDGSVIMRQIVYNQAGSRKEEVEKDERIRDHRPLTRSCCPARIRARLDKKFNNGSVSDKAQAKNLHDIGIRTCHILGYLATQKGGYANLPFNQKDMYNLITQYRKEKVKGGDANAAISYLREFKVRWEDMVARYNLSSNSWVVQTYEMRNLWALEYLRDQFFGRIRTTSQCEGINSLIKAYVRKKDTLLEFINNMETVVSHYRNNERVAEFNSKYTAPVLVTSLPTLEDFAAKTFTRKMFREVRKEIEGACAMNTELVIQDGGKLYFKCNIFGVPEIHHVVEFDRVRGILRCECVLGAECSRLMDLACKNSSDFVEAMNSVVDTITKLQKRGENPRNANLDDDCVGDPLVVKSKGAPKKNSKFKQQRKCSNCGVTGHYNKSCPNAPGRIPKEPVDDDTETNISSILPKRKRHDSVKNQHKMEKDSNIGGGTAPTSAAKSAFIDQVKTSSLGPNIPVCASTSNEESGMGSIPAGSSVVAPETGMAA
ncbi:hypothetical protein Ahy_B10g100539 [Arachis hypogaea]|uniref:CCHC-type domain-containing protein n=1 Tax=Arachis hypogaea TaxID=3818 RepID=A0A444WX56_ARAHY|nr:hypothetical protein Ahy_B10g100539 [Arachis hypogaea]